MKMSLKRRCQGNSRHYFDSDFDDALPENLEPKDVCLLTPFNRHKDRLR